MEFLGVFNTILYEHEFQNPQIFQQTISLFPEHSTLAKPHYKSKDDCSGKKDSVRIWLENLRILNFAPHFTVCCGPCLYSIGMVVNIYLSTTADTPNLLSWQTLDLILSMKMAILSFKNIMAILIFKFCIDGGQNLSKSAPL
jgi:hypothetical protein